MLETELKVMLTDTQFNAIRDIFEWDCVKEQTNNYYISPDNILKKHGITLRVRTVGGTHTLQVKKHTGKQQALQIAEESEFEISEIPMEMSEDAVEGYTGIRVSASLIGELATLRHSYFFCDGVEICLDKSTYLGCTDYELEIEYTTPIPDELLEILSRYDISFDKPCRGKFSRFMGRLLG